MAVICTSYLGMVELVLKLGVYERSTVGLVQLAVVVNGRAAGGGLKVVIEDGWAGEKKVG